MGDGSCARSLPSQRILGAMILVFLPLYLGGRRFYVCVDSSSSDSAASATRIALGEFRGDRAGPCSSRLNFSHRDMAECGVKLTLVAHGMVRHLNRGGPGTATPATGSAEQSGVWRLRCEDDGRPVRYLFSGNGRGKSPALSCPHIFADLVLAQAGSRSRGTTRVPY